MYKIIIFESEGKEYKAELYCNAYKEKGIANVYNRGCDYTIIKHYTINYIESIDGAIVSSTDALKEAIEDYLYNNANYQL
jgi:hypothetical protein